jgi:hypothetical protein
MKNRVKGIAMKMVIAAAVVASMMGLETTRNWSKGLSKMGEGTPTGGFRGIKNGAMGVKAFKRRAKKKRAVLKHRLHMNKIGGGRSGSKKASRLAWR